MELIRHSRPHPIFRLRAFTLIELLAAIAVIGILASLLIVATGRASKSTEKVECASNLRQILMGMQSFANEHNGGILRWIEQDDRAANANIRYDTYWYSKLVTGGYMPSPDESEVWKCPANDVLNRPGTEEPYTDGALAGKMTYAINAVSWRHSKDGLPGPSMVQTATPPYTRNSIYSIDPSTTIALCDGSSWLIYEGSGAYQSTAKGVHNGGMNAVFWDGHVEFFDTPLPNSHAYFSVSPD